jgi:hypothetical protein
MPALPERTSPPDLLQVKQHLEDALEILDRTQNWILAAPIATVISKIDGLLGADHTCH